MPKSSGSAWKCSKCGYHTVGKGAIARHKRDCIEPKRAGGDMKLSKEQIETLKKRANEYYFSFPVRQLHVVDICDTALVLYDELDDLKQEVKLLKGERAGFEMTESQLTDLKDLIAWYQDCMEALVWISQRITTRHILSLQNKMDELSAKLGGNKTTRFLEDEAKLDYCFVQIGIIAEQAESELRDALGDENEG